MKTVTLKRRWKIGRRFRQTGQQLSINRIFDCFQDVTLCVDQFGFGAGLAMGLLMLVSFLMEAARTAAEKGVI